MERVISFKRSESLVVTIKMLPHSSVSFHCTNSAPDPWKSVQPFKSDVDGAGREGNRIEVKKKNNVYANGSLFNTLCTLSFELKALRIMPVDLALAHNNQIKSIGNGLVVNPIWFTHFQFPARRFLYQQHGKFRIKVSWYFNAFAYAHVYVVRCTLYAKVNKRTTKHKLTVIKVSHHTQTHSSQRMCCYPSVCVFFWCQIEWHNAEIFMPKR